MFVKPAPGVLLRDPVTKQLLSAAPVEGLNKPVTVVPEMGMEVSDFDGFWLRRIRDKDVVKVEPSKKISASGMAASDISQAPVAEKEEK